MIILKKSLAALLACAMVITGTSLNVFAEEQLEETEQTENIAPVEELQQEELQEPKEDIADEEDVNTEPTEDEQSVSEPVTAEINAEQNGLLYTIVNSATIQIDGYNGTETTVTIPEQIEGYPVTAVKASAFRGNLIIKNISLPKTIRTIDYQAFQNCTKLEKVRFEFTEPLTEEELSSKSLTIGGRAFAGCTSLSDINLPENLVQISYESFAQTAITSIMIPKYLTKVYNAGLQGTVWYYGPFYKCAKLKDIRFEEGIKTITSDLFFSNESIETVTIPEGVTSIGSEAFWNASNLKSVTLPESLNTISASAFENCDALSEIVIPKAVRSIGNYAFSSSGSLKKVHFEYTEPLSEEELSSKSLTIGGRAFAGCTSLSEINLPENLVQISYESFAQTAITSITIPKNLTKVYGAGLQGTVWYYGPFYKCANLKDIRFEEGIKTIANHLFFSNESIETVTIPDTVTSIGSEAFKSASNLITVTLPESLNTISNSAFESCHSLTEIAIPKAVRSIGNYAFSSTSLRKVHFEYTEPLSEEELSSKSLTIGGRAFAGCTSLSEINLPENLVQISYESFAQTAITSITIPKYLTKVYGAGLQGTVWYYGPFYKCAKLKDIRFEEGIKTIANHLFFSNESIETVTIPDTVTSIGSEAFRKAENLKYLAIPDSVVSIGSYILSGSPNAAVSCEYYSKAAVYAIDNRIPFGPLSGKITPAAVIDRDQSDYQIDLGGADASGYVNCSVKFSLKKELSNQKIVVYIPYNAELDLDSVRLDGKEFTNFDQDSNNSYREIFNVGVNKGELTFSLHLKDSEKVTSYALMTGTYKVSNFSNTNYEDVIGVVNEAYAGITINAQDRVNQPEVEVTGIATGTETVDLYMNNSFVKTVNVRKNGSWSASVTIDDPKDFYSYRISARFTGTDGQEKRAEKNVVFYSGTPEMNSLVMRYDLPKGVGRTNLLTDDGVRPKVYVDSAKNYHFEVGFDHPENVKKVYVHSKRNGITKTVEAFLNEKTGLFETKDAFDGNEYYIPGKIRVSYEPTDSRPLIGTDFENNADLQMIAELAESCISDAGITAENVESYSNGKGDLTAASIMIPGLVNSDTKDFIKALVETYDALTGTELADCLGLPLDLISLSKDCVTLIDGADGKYVVIEDPYSTSDKIVVFGKLVNGTLDILENVSVFRLEAGSFGSIDELCKKFDTAEFLGSAGTFADVAFEMYNIERDTQELIDYINESPDITDKAGATKAAVDLANDRALFMIITTVMLSMVKASAVMPGPTAVMGLMIAGLIFASTFIFPMRSNNIKSGEFRFRAVMDPSGIVTDSVTGEPLEDVTVSAYWIEDTGEDDFFSKKPSDDEYGVLWDASEYEQANPDKTNAEGRYHWDVPEGWWRVKYEKEGYETQWSWWMTVPPIQTKVDVALVPIAQEGGDELKSIQLTDRNIAVGESFKLIPTVEPSGAKAEITWSSSNEDLVTVDADGTIHGIKADTARITAAAQNGIKAECTVNVYFTDVPLTGKYYSAPVYWAVKNGITNGYKDNDGLSRTFKPQNNCTREAVVTFLWRLAGKPNPKSMKSPFSDVQDSGKYYYKAVLWAVEKGITKGYSDGTFKPDATCLREHVVTFLYRYAGKPAPKTAKNPFNDVYKSDYYYAAAIWANENGIAKGYSEGEHASGFGPKLDCLREHVVTFLYRYNNKYPK